MGSLWNIGRVYSNTTRALCVHADQGWYDHILTGGCDFFEYIARAAPQHGLDCLVFRDGTLAARRALRLGKLHILIGPKRHHGPNIFHAQPSYINGFWNLDPKGYFWNSSVVAKSFDPDQVNAAEAQYFFDGVAGYNLSHNQSKRPQTDRNGTLPKATAAFFAQNIERYKNPVHYLDTATILETMARSLDGPVLVKHHPLSTTSEKQTIDQLVATFPNLTLTTASVHDIIAVSDMVVTQNSATGFEALLHQKPVITCAQTDYHHATTVAQSQAELVAALTACAKADPKVDVKKYVYWYLGLNMLEPQKPQFAQRAWNRLLKLDGA